MKHWMSAAAAALGIALAAPAVAKADTVAAVDLNWAVALGDGRAGDSGFGVDGRLGYHLNLILLHLTPEAGIGYLTVPAGPGVNAGIFHGYVGARVGFGALIQPSAFMHLGVGHASVANDSVTKLNFDVGAALDFTALPIVDLGVHISYNTLGELDWLNLGLHAAVSF